MSTNTGGPGFSGSKGPGADINLSVPLPGAFSGRYLLKISDIPDDYWLESAKAAGTSYAELLGVTLDPSSGAWKITSADRLVGTWTTRKAIAAKVSGSELETVKSTLISDAAVTSSTNGSLNNWISQGQVFSSVTAKLTQAE